MVYRGRVAVGAVLVAGVILAAAGSEAWAAGAVANFDAMSLPAPGYYNGGDGAGGFTSGAATFNNTYTDYGSFGAWGGWAVSAKTDATTSGYVNQYSAAAGTAQSGSNYAVGYVDAYTPTIPTLTLAQPAILGQAYFTNTTYAYMDMLYGDPAFHTKQFGGPSGTDPDWFLLTLTGKNSAGTVTGHVLFYLADFRSANAADHTIVKDWTPVDLSGLGTVKTVEFTLTSSDTDEVLGMNTPAYFAMDTLTPEPATLALVGVGAAVAAWRRRRVV
jgi:hypothetical protein